ncbi:SGNH/GDSL hydrolase family protein [Amycolatopsis rhabdoformis]|uniref:SGNH/GDSL hydrolase family protein n=1 Tax=Amycolatopsis rhabdoformis TaxID=1448059 RepID=A0ABZ1HYF0_9PSEU|nr:SGNH/GDSL hydrolase family protein [Amycolatopsis rhabdoformis]WSE27165.1 SGNH/GDSL hydrolase family protein [Amycolatopsis rhabdoformis]
MAHARARGYDDGRQLYGMSAAAIRRWRWKRAAAVAGTGSARYAKIGDSISAGQGLQPATQSPPVVMAGLLAAHGFPVRGASVILNPRTMTADARLSFTGAWSEYAPGVLTTFGSAAASGDSVTLTALITDAGDYLARVITTEDSRECAIAVDGEVAPAKLERAAGLVTHLVPLPGLAAGRHTVTVTVAGGTGELRVGSIGIEAVGGITIGDFGISMSTTADWVAGGAAHSALNHVVAWAPDLALIALMTNDANEQTAVAPAAFATNLDAMVSALETTCDVVLEAQIPGDPGWVDLTPYREAVYDVADAHGVPVLDLFDRWGSHAAAAGAGLMNDAFHPNAAGAADIAAAEFGVVSS